MYYFDEIDLSDESSFVIDDDKRWAWRRKVDQSDVNLKLKILSPISYAVLALEPDSKIQARHA